MAVVPEPSPTVDVVGDFIDESGDTVTDPLTPAQLGIVLETSGFIDDAVDSVLTNWEVTSFSAVEEGNGRTVYEAHGLFNIASSLLNATLFVYVYETSTVMPFELYVNNCNQALTPKRQDVYYLDLKVNNDIYPALDLFIANNYGAPYLSGDKFITRLIGRDWVMHGQGWPVFTGRFIKAIDQPIIIQSEGVASLYGQALNWSSSDMWGPLSTTPHQLHPVENTAERNYGGIARDYWYSHFYNLVNNPQNLWYGAVTPRSNPHWRFMAPYKVADSGYQQDFGVSKAGPFFQVSGGHPLHLYELLPAFAREGCRPSHFYETDGKQLISANHPYPNWATWGFLTHYSWYGKNRDTLGKISGPTQSESHNWWVNDHAHVTNHSLCAYAILTGSHMARHLCRNNMIDMVNHVPGWENRGWGRWPDMISWYYWATKDEDLKNQLIDDYMNGRHSYPFDGYIASANNSNQVCFPFPNFSSKMTNKLGGLYEWWPPWQDAIVIRGMWQLLQVEENTRLRQILDILCEHYIRWCWFEYPTRSIEPSGFSTFWEIRSNFGAAIPDDWYNYFEGSTTPFYCTPRGTGTVAWWGYPAVKISAKVLTDKYSAAHELVTKANAIATTLIARRNAKINQLFKPPIGFDTESEWLPVDGSLT